MTASKCDNCRLLMAMNSHSPLYILVIMFRQHSSSIAYTSVVRIDDSARLPGQMKVPFQFSFQSESCTLGPEENNMVVWYFEQSNLRELRKRVLNVVNLNI